MIHLLSPPADDKVVGYAVSSQLLPTDFLHSLMLISVRFLHHQALVVLPWQLMEVTVYVCGLKTQPLLVLIH
jgi:hypothetical protein